jgi:hypothetical protein
LVKGIGPILAKKLVGRFGAEVLAVIEKRPERLHKRRYRSTRFPRHVYYRVIERLSAKSAQKLPTADYLPHARVTPVIWSFPPQSRDDVRSREKLGEKNELHTREGQHGM